MTQASLPERAKRPEVAVGAIVLYDGSMLLVKRGTEPHRGRWSIPGGRVEAGETLAEAVEREVFEETGLAVSCGAFVGCVERISDEHHFVILDFLASTVDAAPRPIAGTDADEARFVSTQMMFTIDLVDGLFDFFVEHGLLGT